MKFLNFVNDSNIEKSNVAYTPGFIFGDHLEDINIKFEIVNGELIFKCIKDHLSDEDVENVNAYLELCNPEKQFEFIDFYKSTEFLHTEILYLIADENSDMFNKINSQSNINILNNIEKKLNKL